ADERADSMVAGADSGRTGVVRIRRPATHGGSLDGSAGPCRAAGPAGLRRGDRVAGLPGLAGAAGIAVVVAGAGADTAGVRRMACAAAAMAGHDRAGGSR